MGFFTQLVSALNTFVGGVPTHSRGRGRGGGVRRTRENPGRPHSIPAQSHGHDNQNFQDSESHRGRPNHRAGGQTSSRGAYRGRGRSSRSRGPSARRGGSHFQQTTHYQDQAPPPQSDRFFRSENPDFVNMIKGLNQGSRLQHAQQNWERLPSTIDRAIDRVSDSIKPPLSDDKLTSKIKRAADQFKFTVVHTVQQHFTDKYSGVCRHLASVDDMDFGQAKNIAKKQITRGSGRISE